MPNVSSALFWNTDGDACEQRGLVGRRKQQATWIASNLLITAAVFAENGDQFFDALGKLLRIQGLYFDRRPEDGYCDEGPIYWTKAGGELVLFFHNLERLFPGSTNDILSLPKFANIAEFPARTAYTEEYSGISMYIASPIILSPFYCWRTWRFPAYESAGEQRFDGWLHAEECQWHSQLPSNGEFIRDLCLCSSICRKKLGSPENSNLSRQSSSLDGWGSFE